MKKCALIFFILFLICFISSAYSQSKYGNATMDEMNMTVYPQDTTAAAVILLKQGDTRFVYSDLYGFQFEHTVQVKIKILKNEGLKWCDNEINYFYLNNSNKEDIRSLSGTTYNLENGKIVKTKLSKEYIFDEDTDKRWKLKKFTMPAAKVGSVIEYKYTLVSDFFYDLRDFTFQASIPIDYTYYEIKIPEYYKFNTNFQGHVRIDTKRDNANESFHIRYRDENGRAQSGAVRCTAERFRFEGKQVPAIKDETYLWTINDFITKISFELKSIQYPYEKIKHFTSSWEKIDTDIMNSSSFGGNLKKTDLFKNEITKGEVSLTRAQEIMNMVKYRVKWNDRNSVTPKNLKDALKDGIGNSGDVNFLLVNALQAGGFNAFPVIMSTRENGRMPITHPSTDAFNYVITGVQIDTMLYFTDAAAKYGDWNILPKKCMVPQARMMTPNGGRWVNLTNIFSNSILKVASLEFKDSKLQGKVTETLRGYPSSGAKASYFSHKDENDYIEALAKRLACNIDDFKATNLDNTAETLKLEYTQSTDAVLGDEFLYINPLIEKVFSNNPFKAEERTFPVQFDFLYNYVQIVDIVIPEGYEVDELPKPEKLVFNDNDLSLTYRINKSSEVIKLHYQLQLRKLQFLPEEYESLRDFFSKIVQKNSEQVVLKKVSEI